MLTQPQKELVSSCDDLALAPRDKATGKVKPQPRVCSHVCHGICANCAEIFPRMENIKPSVRSGGVVTRDDGAVMTLWQRIPGCQRVRVRKSATRVRGMHEYSQLGASVSKVVYHGEVARIARMTDRKLDRAA